MSAYSFFTKNYGSYKAHTSAHSPRYAIADSDRDWRRFSAHDVRGMADVLAYYGYSPMAAKRLLREGYNDVEVEILARFRRLDELGVGRIMRPRTGRSR